MLHHTNVGKPSLQVLLRDLVRPRSKSESSCEAESLCLRQDTSLSACLAIFQYESAEFRQHAILANHGNETSHGLEIESFLKLTIILGLLWRSAWRTAKRVHTLPRIRTSIDAGRLKKLRKCTRQPTGAGSRILLRLLLCRCH